MNYYTPAFFTILAFLFTPHFTTSQTVKVELLWSEKADVRTIEFTNDDSFLVTGGATGGCYPYQCGQIKIWSVSDSTVLNTTRTYMGLTNDIAVSSDGQTIMSGNGSGYCAPDGGCAADKPGQFKFSINGALKKSLGNPGGVVYAIAYSPNDSIIAAGTGYNNTGQIRIYNNNFSLLRIVPGHASDVTGLAFTPDGQYLISGGDDGLIKFWNYKNGTLIRKFRHGTYLDGGAYVNVAVSPNGKYLASAGQGYNMTVKIWRISDGKLLHTLPIDGGDGYSVVKFSPDGKQLAAGVTQYGSGGLGWYGRILFWNVSDGTLLKKYVDKQGSPLSGGIRAIAFSSLNNNYLAYSVSDRLKLAKVEFNAPVAGIAITKSISGNAEFEATAFPNPFRSFTTIQFNVPSKQFVTLKVFDIVGREVAILENEEKEAGLYNIIFNATKLSRGVFFYKLTVGSYCEVKKIVLYR